MCSGHGKHNAKIFRVIMKEDVKLAKGVIELRMHPDNVSEFSKIDLLKKPKMRVFDAVCKLTVFAELFHILLALPALREALKTLTPYEGLDYRLKKEFLSLCLSTHYGPYLPAPVICHLIPGVVLLCVAPARVPPLSLFLQPVIQALIWSQSLECLPQSRKSQKDVEELRKHGELAHGVENAHLGFLQKIYLGEFRDIIRMHAEFDNPLGQLDILLHNHSKNLGIVLPMSRAHLGQPPRGHRAIQTIKASPGKILFSEGLCLKFCSDFLDFSYLKFVYLRLFLLIMGMLALPLMLNFL
ncbi:hypothetical protein TB2_043281 [Malus domestica]